MASSEIWTKRVAAWRASGLKADKYAAGRGFAGSTLRWWSSHLGRRAPAIVQVVRAVPARDATLELVVGDVRVLVRSGFDRALLGEVSSTTVLSIGCHDVRRRSLSVQAATLRLREMARNSERFRPVRHPGRPEPGPPVG